MGETLSKPQLLAVLKAAKATRSRDWLMILMAFSHGLRASEVVALTKDSICGDHLDVRRLKGSKRTVQPLLTSDNSLLDERTAVFEYVAQLRGNQPLFDITRQHFWRLFRRYCQAAKVPKHLAHPHILKHTIAHQVIHSAGIENVQQYLGHKSLSSTGAYLKVSDAEASEAVRRGLDV